MNGILLVRQAAGQILHRFISKGIILMYHRIAQVEADPWSLCVTPEHFTEHLEVVKKVGHPVSLGDLVKAVRIGKVPDHSIVITFDDGYADNLYFAKPVLERFDAPASVFIVAGAIGEENEFWWDELERLLLQPDQLPEALSLSIEGNSFVWQLSRAAFYSLEHRQKDRTLRPWEANPGSRLAFFYSVWEKLMPLDPAERRKVLDKIAIWSGNESMARSTHRVLTPEEVIALQQGGLIEVGAHTATHRLLPSLSRTSQREEIQRSKDQIESLLGHPVASFAYPHGECTPETISLVRNAGYTCACSVAAGCVYPGANPFFLPRFEVQDWDGDEFARRLSEWFRTGMDI